MSFLGIGGGPSLNTNAAAPYMGALTNLANSFGSNYNAANTGLAGANTDYQNALKSYSSYLTSNPATNQYNASQVANAEAGASEGAQNALANTEASLARRGISPKSGIFTGALANVNEGLAANNARIQSAVGQNNIDRHAANLAANANLMSGAQQTAFGQADTLGTQAAGLNENLYNDAYQQALQDYNDKLQQEQAPLGLISGVANMFGGAFAPGGAFAQKIAAAKTTSN